MKTIFGNKKSLMITSVLLATLIIAVGFWQYRDAEAIRIESSGDYLSIGMSLSPEVGHSEGFSAGAYSGSAVIEKSTNYYEIDYPGSGSKIGIGDVSKASNFKPDLTVSTWNGEAQFQLIGPAVFEEKSQLTTSLSGGNISASNGQWKFEYRPTEPKAGFNDKGGLDVLMTALQKPSSNVIDFAYVSKTVTPYYQPSLTAEYKDGWSDGFKADIKVSATQVVNAKDGSVLVERPEHVVNSIAFYADNKSGDMTALGGKNYGAGKVGHLYRMKAVDSVGKSAWLDWSMPSQTQIRLTDTAGILQTGAYPIEIQPVGDTFGYTSSGASNFGVDTNTWAGSLFTAPASGSGVSISVYCRNWQSSNTPQIKGVLVNNSGLTIVSNGITNATNTGNNVPMSWITCNFGTSPAIAASDYVIGFIPYYYHGVGYDTGATNQGHVDTNNSFAAPTNPSGITYSTNKLSIYTTYTISSSISNAPSSYQFSAVAPGTSPSTPSLNYFTVHNNSGSAVNITIGGTDMTGGITWTLSDAGTPGVSTAALKAGPNVSGGDYTITVRKNAPFNTLISNLAPNADQGWGLRLWAPTNTTDTIQKAGTVTLTATTP